jgi:hypothetical protein
LSIPDQTVSPPARRRWLVLAFSLVLTVGTLYVVFRGIDRQVFEQLLARQNRGLLAAAAGCVVLQIFAAGERWRAILSALVRGKLSMRTVQAVFYSSVFFNVLPFGAVGGDVVRIWLARRFAIPLGHLLLSVLADRIITLTALLILVLVTLPTIAVPLAGTVWLAGVAIFAAGVIGILLLGPIERALGKWRDRRLIYLLVRTAEELRHLTRKGGFAALLYALVSGICMAFSAYFIARSLDIAVALPAMIAAFSMVAVFVALPISMAGWGVREVSVVALLGLLGVDREAALILSVEFGLLNTLLSLPGGVIWLTLRDRRKVALPSQ